MKVSQVCDTLLPAHSHLGPDCTGITACSSNPCQKNEKCTPVGSSYECEKDISKLGLRFHLRFSCNIRSVVVFKKHLANLF